MKNLKKFLFLLLTAIIIFAGCSKEGPEGPQGPIGNQGWQGEQGPSGQVGPTGPAGQNGNANVDSYIFTVYPADWIEAGNVGEDNYQYFVNLNVPAITNDIVSNGVVMVYIVESEYNIALPTLSGTYGSWETHLVYAYAVSSVIISILDTDLFTIAPDDITTFRVVVIEGNSFKNAKADDIDFENYKELKEYFNISE